MLCQIFVESNMGIGSVFWALKLRKNIYYSAIRCDKLRKNREKYRKYSGAINPPCSAKIVCQIFVENKNSNIPGRLQCSLDIFAKYWLEIKKQNSNIPGHLQCPWDIFGKYLMKLENQNINIAGRLCYPWDIFGKHLLKFENQNSNIGAYATLETYLANICWKPEFPENELGRLMLCAWLIYSPNIWGKLNFVGKA